jgi:hypothetical protein
VVVESDIPDIGQDPVDLVRGLDGSMVEVRGGFPDWWGYDTDGRVVAGAAAMDVTPPTYRAVLFGTDPLGQDRSRSDACRRLCRSIA